ncbi:MAG TPA: hypothetical protein VJ277_05705 [Gemmatimonadales bacterium]|nr:hypothetical protein [Gemmatimonadales bacterium]
MYVEATPLMVTADVTPLVTANVGELLDLLMSDEFFQDFMEIADAEPSGQHDGHAPERLAFEQLAARLVDRMSTRVALTGPQAVRVAGRMHKLGLPLAEAVERKKAAVAKATEALILAAERREGGAAA